MSCGKHCTVCGSPKKVQDHHIIFKSKVKALARCKLNIVPLCEKCHSFLHSKKGEELDRKMKLIFLNRIEIKFLKRYIKFEEIKEALDISDTATHKLTDCMVRYKEGYKREELIRRCMGDEFYE